LLFPFATGLVKTNKFDPECAELADRHYSRQKIRSPQFAPPGETLILRDTRGLVLFVWCHQLQRRADGQEGINCTIFRNESARQSSEIILEAEQFALHKWGDIRAFTYIDPAKIRSQNPGYCFKIAGWKQRGRSASGKILIEKFLSELTTVL